METPLESVDAAIEECRTRLLPQAFGLGSVRYRDIQFAEGQGMLRADIESWSEIANDAGGLERIESHVSLEYTLREETGRWKLRRESRIGRRLAP